MSNALRKYFGEDTVYLEHSQAYCAALDSIPLDIPLPYDLFLKFQNSLILFRRAPDPLTSKRCNELIIDGVDALYIRKSDWDAFIKSIENFIEPGVATETYISHVRDLLLAYGRILEKEPIIRPGLMGRAQALMQILVEVVVQSPQMASLLIRKYRDPNLYFNNHNLNVAIYSLLIGLTLKLQRPELERLTIAALFHNIGNIFVPEAVLYKKDSLNYEEFSQVQPHADLGAKILKSLKLDDEVIQTALQHHERVDGKGYPQNYQKRQIHLYAKICSIADVYDALTSHRPYREPITPNDALKTMRKMEGKFDPMIFAAYHKKS